MPFKKRNVENSKIKAIIFDFDGTIADTFKEALKVANQLSKKYGYSPINYKKAIKLKDKDSRKIVKKDLKLSLFKLPKYTREMKEGMLKNYKNIKMYPSMKNILNKLSKKIEIGIITSNSKELIDRLLKKYRIKKIKFTYCNSSIFGKHFVIKRVLKHYNLDKEDVLYVGDEARDVKACKKLGIKIVSVTWGYNSPKILKKLKSDFLINKPNELLNCAEDYFAHKQG